MSRQKGSLNFTTRRAKEVVATLLEESLSTIISDIKVLEPKDRVKLIIDLLPFVLAKIRPQQVITLDTITNEQSQQLINDLLKEDE